MKMTMKIVMASVVLVMGVGERDVSGGLLSGFKRDPQVQMLINQGFKENDAVKINMYVKQHPTEKNLSAFDVGLRLGLDLTYLPGYSPEEYEKHLQITDVFHTPLVS